MTFKNILLVYSEKISERHLSLVKNLKENINNRLGVNCDIKIITEMKKHDLENRDLIITAGGDGVFIRTAYYLGDTPVLGINSEPELSEGALTSLDDTDTEKLVGILNGKFKIIERQRIEIKINKKKIDELALNDVYLGSRQQFHTSRYIIEINGEKEEQRSSGVLVVSGSGSSAWYKSAGGNPFDYSEEKLRFLVREPFSGRIFNPKLTKGEIKKGASIVFIGKRYNEGIIALDSNKTYDFNNDDEVEIKLSDKPLKVIIPCNPKN